MAFCQTRGVCYKQGSFTGRIRPRSAVGAQSGRISVRAARYSLTDGCRFRERRIWPGSVKGPFAHIDPVARCLTNAAAERSKRPHAVWSTALPFIFLLSGQKPRITCCSQTSGRALSGMCDSEFVSYFLTSGCFHFTFRTAIARP